MKIKTKKNNLIVDVRIPEQQNYNNSINRIRLHLFQISKTTINEIKTNKIINHVTVKVYNN